MFRMSEGERIDRSSLLMRGGQAAPLKLSPEGAGHAPPPQNRTCGSPRIRLKPLFSTTVWHRATLRSISWLDDGRSIPPILDRTDSPCPGF